MEQIQESNKSIEQESYQDESGNMGFIEAVKICFAKYATFEGRASRSEYWWFALFYFLVMIVCGILAIPFADSEAVFLFVMALMVIASLAMIVPIYAVSIRRLHDIGKSGWFILLFFIPYVGALIGLYFVCKQSDFDNEYGEIPEK